MTRLEEDQRVGCAVFSWGSPLCVHTVSPNKHSLAHRKQYAKSSSFNMFQKSKIIFSVSAGSEPDLTGFYLGISFRRSDLFR